MTSSALEPGTPVHEIMRRWPATIRVMLRYQMLCIGCPVGPYHTVPEACAAHRIDEAAFWNELILAIEDEDNRAEPPAPVTPGLDGRDTVHQTGAGS